MANSSVKKRKKRSRDSSQRKKSKRNKSKKLLRRRDHSDNSELSGKESSSSSYSSSGDDYRRKKRRSRGKAEGKCTRKRLRRCYSSSESDDDDSGHLKRKRSSKRKDDHVRKKRTRLRNKHRRDVSSASSESCSPSRSRSDSGNSGEDEERKRVKFERRAKDRGSRERSRDCSSCGHDSEADDYHHVRDEFTSERSAKRLRSVVTVLTTSNSDEGKEEMVYDRDDYPSCRSNDSNEGNDKREFERYEACVEENFEYDEEGEAIISSPRIGANKEENEDDVEMKTNQGHDVGDSSKGEDLEAILRVRALENLKKFRGENQRNVVTSKEVSTAADGEPLKIEAARVEDLTGCHFLEQEISAPVDKTDLESSRKLQNAVSGLKESGSVPHDLASPMDQQSVSTSKEKASAGVNSSSTRPKLIRPTLRQENSNHLSTSKQATKTQDTQVQSTSRDTIDKSCPESSQTSAAKSESDNVKRRDANDSPRKQSLSYTETQSGRGGLDKSQGKEKEGSQFEQRMMSVMRGGETVQVSYKVYIPKKTPALARRTLKR